jgi:hypothetical protein
MDEHIEFFLEQFGQPTHFRKVDPAYIERYRNKLPDKLIAYWLELGFSGFKDGLFWIVDPSEFDGAMNLWIEDLPIVEQDKYHVIARNGFGDLYLWGEETGYKYKLNVCNGWILEKKKPLAKLRNEEKDLYLQIFFSNFEVKNVDLKDDAGGSLFNKAVEKYGPLEQNEVFGFEPALFLGGKQKLENVNKLDIHVHLSILADFGHREILNRKALIQKAFG